VFDEDLCWAAGVYVIAIRNGARDRIRYIGMTYEQGFRAEVFSQRNERDVWSVLDQQKGRQVVWLFVKPTPTGRGFSWDQRVKSQAHLLEQLLIMHARASGHTLVNTKKMKSAEAIAVKGLFGTRRAAGQLPSSVRTIANALNL
jgi:hypothetical protein